MLDQRGLADAGFSGHHHSGCGVLGQHPSELRYFSLPPYQAFNGAHGLNYAITWMGLRNFTDTAGACCRLVFGPGLLQSIEGDFCGPLLLCHGSRPLGAPGLVNALVSFVARRRGGSGRLSTACAQWMVLSLRPRVLRGMWAGWALWRWLSVWVRRLRRCRWRPRIRRVQPGRRGRVRPSLDPVVRRPRRGCRRGVRIAVPRRGPIRQLSVRARRRGHVGRIPTRRRRPGTARPRRRRCAGLG